MHTKYSLAAAPNIFDMRKNEAPVLYEHLPILCPKYVYIDVRFNL